jgi:hypothetical protein
LVKEKKMAVSGYSRSREPSEATLEVEALLRRYPNLADYELATLINELPRLPILDYGLMTADDELSEKLTEFHGHHGRKLRTPLSSLVAFLAVPATLLVLLVGWAIFFPTGM